MSNEEQDTRIIQAAARVLISAALDLIQQDPHGWSTRPCTTCAAVTQIIGQPFGCIKYAKDGK